MQYVRRSRLSACIPLLIVAAVLSVSLGCSRESAQVIAPDPFVWNEAGDFPEMSPEELEKYQPDMRMSARWENGWVWVQVRNRSGKQLAINEANFAAIVDGKLFRVKPGDAEIFFPRILLRPGEMATGRFRFFELGDLAGQKFVFNHTSACPSVVFIEGAGKTNSEGQEPAAEDSGS